MSLSLVEWLHVGRYEYVEEILEDINELGITRLRTGISWADWHLPTGREWYEWLIPKLAQHVEILPCITYTPPTLGIAPSTAAPPRRLQDYADFVDVVLDEFGHYFEWVELWNEPNNRMDWDFFLDPDWSKFCEMVGKAAYWAQHRGKKTVLGGMSPVDPDWITLVGEQGLLEWIDVVGLHGFPGTWDVGEWQGWEKLITVVLDAISPYNKESEIWITEVGASSFCVSPADQEKIFNEAISAPCSRVYWYSLRDLHPELPTQEGLWVDERHYHFGFKTFNGRPKKNLTCFMKQVR